jgi:hypothetical protein
MDALPSSGEFGVGGEAEKNVQLAALFRQHLQGLFTVLHQMTDAADMLSKAYAESIGA